VKRLAWSCATLRSNGKRPVCPEFPEGMCYARLRGGDWKMTKKMTKLKAFKGRSRGQQKRRKKEAVEEAVGKAMAGVVHTVRHGVHRFPRSKAGS